MAEPQVNLVLDSQTDLGEGPVWDERTGRLYFVDINKQQIHVYTPSAQGADKHFTISTPVSYQGAATQLPCSRSSRHQPAART